MEVEVRKLNKKCNKLGLGAGPFGGIYGETDTAECGKTLDLAFKSGVTYVDTAPWYGQGKSFCHGKLGF